MSVRDFTIKELSVYDDDFEDRPEVLRLTTDPQSEDLPVDIKAFNKEDSVAVLETSLSRSDCKELRDFLNSLDLD